MSWTAAAGYGTITWRYQAAGYTWFLSLPNPSVHTVDNLDDRDGSCTPPHSIQGREVSVNLLVEDLQDVDAGNLLRSLHTARPS